ncbi:hypothetical protein OG413_20275 [Streptomyces sp. NBC_01433]|uniref:hypothetical protein n=1 Tax=Streptomyces sp. NBC_01433 TaxID=2903864 RepID=UPI00224D3933|nr:hypothetical protein [Streptomyces sp. NBC_01433]MCX4677611.1 hypothetical protein [Streptomyces sp. NBC_01433]
MSVILANRQLTLSALAHPWARDANGVPVPPAPDQRPEPRGTWPGSALEQPDGTWSLRLDPAAWPVEPGDVVADETGMTWTLTTARLHQVPGCPDVDYVQAAATRNPPKVP